jgi:hypothetical protein
VFKDADYKIADLKKELKAAREELADKTAALTKKGLTDSEKKILKDGVLADKMAVGKAVTALKRKQREKNAAKKLRQEIKNMKEQILRPPAQTIWIDQRNEIRELQEDLQKQDITLDLLREYKNKKKTLESIGRATWQNIQTINRERRLGWMRQISAELMKEAAAGKTAGAKRAAAAATADDAERQRIIDGNVVERFLDKAALFKDWDMRFGGISETVKELLYDMQYDAYVQKHDNIHRRLLEILPDFYNQNKEMAETISVKNIYLPKVGKGNQIHAVSKAILMTLHIGLENPHMKATYIYGNMMTAEQRLQMKREYEAPPPKRKRGCS